MALPWKERVTALSINPDAATRSDVARLADEWGEQVDRIRELEEDNARLRKLETEALAARHFTCADGTPISYINYHGTLEEFLGAVDAYAAARAANESEEE